MRGKRYSEEQIIKIILHEGEADASTKDLCRRHGIAEQTYYRWRRKYGGLDVSELKRLKSWPQASPQVGLSTPEPAAAIVRPRNGSSVPPLSYCFFFAALSLLWVYVIHAFVPPVTSARRQ